MVLKLYGSPVSTCTRRVATVLTEKKVPFEFHPIDFAKGEHKAPAFLQRQPFGQVPYLDDDGFILFESRAMARYIALKYRGQGTQGLIPDVADLHKNALFEQAASIEQSNFDMYASAIAAEKVFKPMRGGETNEKAVEFYVAQLDGKLKGYEAILSKQKYLAGDELTLADLFHLPYGALLEKIGYDFLSNESKNPNVVRWWKDITSRASWQAVKDGVKTTA